MPFTNLLAEFDAANTVVIGISKDTLAKQAKFRAKRSLQIILGADSETSLASNSVLHGLENQCMENQYRIERSTFLIDRGKVTKFWRKVKIRVMPKMF